MFRPCLKFLAFIFMMVAAVAMFGCEGDTGSAGPAGSAGTEGEQGVQGDPGPAGATDGTVAGTVTNSATLAGIASLTITTDPVITGTTITTDANGAYTADLPIGMYTLTFAETNFTTQTKSVNLVAGQTVTTDVALVPTSDVIASIDSSAVTTATAVPGGSFTLTASETVMDGSSILSYAWTQAASAQATITGADTATPTITLGDMAAYKAELMKHLVSNMGTDPAANLDRFMVQPVNPFALEEAGLVTFQVAITTTTGTYTKSVDVHAKLPFAVWSTGTKNVPLGLPVLLNGKDQAAYAWTLTGPAGSTAALDDATVRNPSFTPDLKGEYTVGETNSPASFKVYGGEWVGVITGQNGSGRPTTSADCALCHDGNTAPSQQFTDWPESGHAEIFTNNFNTSTHYGTGCFPCHTVGYNTDAANNGFDDQSDYDAFVGSGMLNVPGDNWTTMLASYPNSAQQANIQCENCHGPQNSQGGHAGQTGAPRVSLDSGVCASCHGEPLRHARFQQWEEAGHGNFATAIGEGTLTYGCANCHSAQGFVEWSKATLPFDKDYTVVGVPTADEVQPQTCAACHDPHAQGKTSGEPNTATVRTDTADGLTPGTTPELQGGFVAVGVGRGALCMICHNDRRGPYSTSLYGENYYNGKAEMEDQATHGGPQSDILMGENAFFVTPGARGSHSLITDTCANCHMEQTPPPAELSYDLAGTNHSFEPSITICTNCHQISVAETLQSSVEAQLAQLGTALTAAIKTDIETIAANATVTALLLNYKTSDSSYSGMIDNSGDDDKTIASIALQTSYPHGYNFTLVDATVVGSGYDDIVVWQDAIGDGGNGDGIVDAAEVERGDITTEGIGSGEIAGIVTNGQNILKAKWNHDLVESDGSKGVHNPDFVRDILNGAIIALK